MKNKIYLFLIPLFAIILIVGVFAFSLQNSNSVPNNVEDSIGYKSNVQIFTTGDFEGRETPLGELEFVGESSNVLYHTGREGIEALIGGAGGADAFDWIEMCNATATGAGCGVPIADSSEAYVAFADCGLSKIAGDYDTLAGNGNWTISTTFTSTCDDVLTNATHLLNDADDELAGNEFTLVSLQTSDTLLINWSVWVAY